MTFLNQVTVYLGLSILLIVLMGVAGVVVFILANRKKKSVFEVYYDSFDRHDSMEYLKFDEIISSDKDEPLKGAGVMVIDQRTFVAALNVTGYNFFSSSYDTQKNTINATISMMDSLEHPISLRQSVKAINISHNIEVFEREASAMETQIRELNNRIQGLIEDSEDYVDSNPELSDEYALEADKLMREMERKNRQLGEAHEMIRYMKDISTDSGDTQKVQTLIFTYKYDTTQFTNQLTKEEIYYQAMIELNSIATSLTSNLFRCGCTARRCTAEELVDMMRRHMHPATSDDVSVEELFHSDIGALFVTSDSLLQVVKEQMTEEAYEKQIEEIYARIEEERKRNTLQSERQEADRMAVTRKMAAKQIHI